MYENSIYQLPMLHFLYFSVCGRIIWCLETITYSKYTRKTIYGVEIISIRFQLGTGELGCCKRHLHGIFKYGVKKTERNNPQKEHGNLNQKHMPAACTFKLLIGQILPSLFHSSIFNTGNLLFQSSDCLASIGHYRVFFQ